MKNKYNWYKLAIFIGCLVICGCETMVTLQGPTGEYSLSSKLVDTLEKLKIKPSEYYMWLVKENSGNEVRYYVYNTREKKVLVDINKDWELIVSLITPWLNNGFTVSEAYLWEKYKFANPCSALEWKKDGFVPESAYAWRGSWYSGNTSKMALYYGEVTSKKALLWLKAGFSSTLAKKYFYLGFLAPDSILQWLNMGFDTVEIKIWHPGCPLFRLDEAIRWKAKGFTADQASKWRSNSFKLEEAIAWKRQEFLPEDAKVWKEVKLSPKTASYLLKNGISLEDFKSFSEYKITYSEILDLLEHGVNLKIYKSYVNYNISYRKMLGLQKEGARGIEGMVTLLYGNIYNLQGRCFEFVGQRLQSLSKTTALYAVGENIYFLDFGNSSAPYIARAAVQVFSTYTYITNMGTVNKVPWLTVLSFSGTDY